MPANRVTLRIDGEIEATDLIDENQSATDWAQSHLDTMHWFDPQRDEAELEVCRLLQTVQLHCPK